MSPACERLEERWGMNHPMSTVGRDIFRAIHEGKWLYIEYRNKSNEVTRYWFDIESIDIDRRMLLGTGCISKSTRWHTA